jgi:hypothetical protein
MLDDYLAGRAHAFDAAPLLRITDESTVLRYGAQQDAPDCAGQPVAPPTVRKICRFDARGKGGHPQAWCTAAKPAAQV